MGKITGVITDQKGRRLEKVLVLLKDNNFRDIATTMTNIDGEYEIEVENGNYPFLMAVREYKKEFLEYWCQNITVSDKEVILNASIDKLEIYGLHCFRIKGAYPALTIYFRPMSLVKVLNDESDIAPNMNKDSLKVSINGEEVEVYNLNKVEEIGSEGSLTGYLMQVSLPNQWRKEKENILDIQISDLDGHFGQASIFF